MLTQFRKLFLKGGQTYVLRITAALATLLLVCITNGTVQATDNSVWTSEWIQAFRTFALREGSLPRRYYPDPGRVVRWEKRGLKVGLIGATAHGDHSDVKFIEEIYKTAGRDKLGFNFFQEFVATDLSPEDATDTDVLFIYVNGPREFGHYLHYVRQASSSEAEHSNFLNSIKDRVVCVPKLLVENLVIKKAVLIVDGTLSKEANNACSAIMALISLGIMEARPSDVETAMDIQANYKKQFGISDLDREMVQLLYDRRINPGDYWQDVQAATDFP